MRILITGVNYLALPGQAIFTVNLAEGLASRGHAVTVLFPSDESRPYSRTRKGVRLEALLSIDLTFLHPYINFPVPSSRAIRRVFELAQPEIVHIQDHYPLSQAIVNEAFHRGVKILGSNHFMPENLAPYVPILSTFKPLFNRVLWRWMQAVYDRTEVVAVQSKAAAALVKAQGLRPPVIPISCGIDLGRFHPDPSVDRQACLTRYGIDPKRKIFLFVGRVDREKRVDVLLHALARLHRSDIHLVIAGKGAAWNNYRTLAESLALGDRVKFTGFIPNDDLPTLLNSVDVFTMPSEAELLSIASLEAMACGKPLLLANAIALPELVSPGVNGYLFKAGDSQDAAHHIALLADQPERWQEMGCASLEKVQPHSLDRTLDSYESLYAQVLSGTLPTAVPASA
jgi:1,2-diacylglycerol 3-alpha-glucosyltransferase